MTKDVRLLTEIAMMSALALILSFIQFEAPWGYGGSVSLEMLPIFLIAFRHGVKAGVLTGVIYGLLQLLTAPTVVHPVQFLMDYPVAYGVIGFAGLLKPNPEDSKKKQAVTIIIATFIGSTLRLVAHLISGAVFFASYTPPGTPVLVYNLTYNASYMIPSFILTAVVLILLLTASPRLLNERTV